MLAKEPSLNFQLKENTTQHVSITNHNSAKSLTIRYILLYTDYKSFCSNLFLGSIFRDLPSKYILNEIITISFSNFIS